MNRREHRERDREERNQKEPESGTNSRAVALWLTLLFNAERPQAPQQTPLPGRISQRVFTKETRYYRNNP